MKSPDELRRDVELLRDRISKLSEASLRISGSLDLGTVLREVVERARALTAARYGIIATIDDSGQVEELVSSGLTQAEQQRLLAFPDGPRLFEHLRDHPGMLRVPDLHSYLRSHGFSAGLMPTTSFQGTPMHHRNLHVGNFFVWGKQNGLEFTNEDGEVLLMFAAQAAAAIANARAFRNEQRARADLEALVDISPVGVAVFDAKSGKLVSFNQETQRILGGLLKPGQTLEDLLKLVTLRRPDGWEISLEETPAAQALSNASTIRAEEIVFQVPDGRSVTTLLNAAPIRAEDGTNESVIVTMQDLAPLEELERLRAEFLGMVSHELRVPLASIRGLAVTVLGASSVPDSAEMLQFFRIIDQQAIHMHGLLSDLLDAGRIEAGTLSVNPEPTDVVALVDQARSTFLSGGGRHTIRIDLPANLPRMMADRRRIVQVLNNLLSNASRHSPESSAIRISAAHDGLYVAVSVADGGQGVPPELLPRLFRKHTRLGDRHGIGGSGLGLAICKGLVEAHGGRIRAESEGPNLGSRFTFTIPVTQEAIPGAGFARSSPISSRDARKHRHILVVDDDPQMLRYVRDALTGAGYRPLVTGDPREVSHLIRTKKPRLVLMDLILPGTDGIELMERVPELADLPVIFISGYGRDETIARALEMGAVDYIVKPFSPTELTARVRAALRRWAETPPPFMLRDLAVHYEERRVTVSGHPVRLTATEYDLLRELSVNAGRIMTYNSLLRRVWDRRESGDHRLVHAYVKRLRRKLGEDAARPRYIFTERRIGYRVPKPSDP